MLLKHNFKHCFFIRPIAWVNFKSATKPTLIYNLYLNLLDWYDEEITKAHKYLSTQGVSSDMYKPYKHSSNYIQDKIIIHWL